MRNREEGLARGSHSKTVREIAAEIGLSVWEVLQLARWQGIGVVDGESKIAAPQLIRLQSEVARGSEPSDASNGHVQVPAFSWNTAKWSLGPAARRLVPNPRTMLAVERIAVAHNAACWLSRRKDKTALVVGVGNLRVVLGHDVRHGRAAFVITAFDTASPRYSDQSAGFLQGADLVADVVPIHARLAVLPKVR